MTQRTGSPTTRWPLKVQGKRTTWGGDGQENYRPARLGMVGLWGAITSPAAEQIYRGRESPKSLPGQHGTCQDRLGAWCGEPLRGTESIPECFQSPLGSY